MLRDKPTGHGSFRIPFGYVNRFSNQNEFFDSRANARTQWIQANLCFSKMILKFCDSGTSGLHVVPDRLHTYIRTYQMHHWGGATHFKPMRVNMLGMCFLPNIILVEEFDISDGHACVRRHVRTCAPRSDTAGARNLFLVEVQIPRKN